MPMPFWYCAGMTLDDFLKSKDPKMSHAAFGEMIGVEQATVTRYVNGERFPSPKIILKDCQGHQRESHRG